MPLVERKDGSQAYLPTQEAAEAYATDVGGTVLPDAETTLSSESASVQPGVPDPAENGAIPGAPSFVPGE